MKKKLSGFLIIFLFFSNLHLAQLSNVYIKDDIYKYITQLSQKGIIDYFAFVKPISRKTVALKLIEIRKNERKLTNLQLAELKYFESEFGYEIEQEKIELRKKRQESSIKYQDERAHLKGEPNRQEAKIDTSDADKNNQNSKTRDLLDKSWQIDVRKPLNLEVKNQNIEQFTFAQKDNYNRWRFFNYNNELMNFNIEPILGYEIANWEQKNYQNIYLGLNFRGNFGNVLGFNFELKQTRESPIVTNFLYNRFSKNTNNDYQLSDSKRAEYAAVRVDIGADWGWGSFTIGKNHLNIGYAESGKIILSEKAPSFPYIRLDIKPTDWLRFNYVHAWLNSEVVDSSSFYSTWRYRSQQNTDKFSYIQKFLALHSVTFSFWNGIDLSLGESVVYSDDLQLGYLIPIMFFDLADEYLNNSNNFAGASTQLFLALSSRNNIPNTHFYSSFHADELTPEGLFDPETQYYKFAFTFGASTIDLPFNNLGLRIEYTKIYPGNYRHFIPSLTYESSSALMGHWIGDNGDLFYAAIDYTFFRGLKLKLWTQYIRKGTEALGNRAYKIQIPQPGFLFLDNISDRKNYRYYGVDLDYQIFHDLRIKAHYQYIDYKQQVKEDQFNSTIYRDISFTFGYGI